MDSLAIITIIRIIIKLLAQVTTSKAVCHIDGHYLGPVWGVLTGLKELWPRALIRASDMKTKKQTASHLRLSLYNIYLSKWIDESPLKGGT